MLEFAHSFVEIGATMLGQVQASTMCNCYFLTGPEIGPILCNVDKSFASIHLWFAPCDMKMGSVNPLARSRFQGGTRKCRE